MKFSVLRKDRIDLLIFTATIQKIAINDFMIFALKLERKKIQGENNNDVSCRVSLENRIDVKTENCEENLTFK